jgi:hypothetical protein
MTPEPVSERCHLVFALAPENMPVRDATRLLNEYVAEGRRGLPVFHDHFVDRPGGVAVFHVRDEDELAALEEPGPLAGWSLDVQPLRFSLTGLGFEAQLEFTLDRYAGTSLARLRAEEEPDPRFWWRRG